MYYLWHTSRQGWVDRNGLTSTELSSAAEFEELEALNRVKQFRDWQGNYLVVPVSIDLMDRVNDE